MKDISKVMQDAIEKSDTYNSEMISKKLEKFHEIWCRLEDDTNMNWYLISETDGKSVKRCFGYLSQKFPVAFLYENCPQEIMEYLQNENILLEEYVDRYSCKENILKQYIDNVKMIDDRFLCDDTIPFDEDVFLEIDKGIQYINPYDFSFDSIK